MTNPTPTTNPAQDANGAPLGIGDRVDIINAVADPPTAGPVFGTGTVVGFSGWELPIQVLVDDPTDPTMELEFAPSDVRKSVGPPPSGFDILEATITERRNRPGMAETGHRKTDGMDAAVAILQDSGTDFSGTDVHWIKWMAKRIPVEYVENPDNAGLADLLTKLGVVR